MRMRKGLCCNKSHARVEIGDLRTTSETAPEEIRNRVVAVLGFSFTAMDCNDLITNEKEYVIQVEHDNKVFSLKETDLDVSWVPLDEDSKPFRAYWPLEFLQRVLLTAAKEVGFEHKVSDTHIKGNELWVPSMGLTVELDSSCEYMLWNSVGKILVQSKDPMCVLIQLVTCIIGVEYACEKAWDTLANEEAER